MGQDDQDIKRRTTWIDLAARIGEKGTSLELKSDANTLSSKVSDKVLRLKSGRICEISIDEDENVYLHYNPKELE